MSTFLFADNEVLVFLRRGSAVMVEMAPKFSNLAIPQNMPEKLNRLFLFFTPFKRAAVPLLLTRSRTILKILKRKINIESVLVLVL